MLFHHFPNSPPLLFLFLQQLQIFLFLQQLQNSTRKPKHPPAKFPSSSFQVFQVKVASFFLSIRNDLPRITWMITHRRGGSENNLAQSLTDGNTPPPIQKLHWPNRRRRGVAMVVAVVSKVLGFGAEFIASSSSVSSCLKSFFRGSPGIYIPSSSVFCPWAKTSFQAGSCCRGFVRLQGLGKSSSHFFWIFASKSFLWVSRSSHHSSFVVFPWAKTNFRAALVVVVSWGPEVLELGGF